MAQAKTKTKKPEPGSSEALAEALEKTLAEKQAKLEAKAQKEAEKEAKRQAREAEKALKEAEKEAERVRKEASDQASQDIIEEALKIAEGTSADEYPLLAKIASLMDDGLLSTRGYQKTIEAIEAEGYGLATFTKSNGQNIQIARDLAYLKGSPQNARKLSSKANAMRVEYGAEEARERILKAIEAGKSYDEVKQPKVESKPRTNGHAQRIKCDVATLETLAQLVTEATQSGKVFDDEVLDALETLQVSIEAYLQS